MTSGRYVNNALTAYLPQIKTIIDFSRKENEIRINVAVGPLTYSNSL